MTTLTLQLPDAHSTYAQYLQNSVARTQRKLHLFEQRYQFSTAQLLAEKTADDLSGGDIDYIEWAGEAKILEGLNEELALRTR
ncbi:MAG: hypothetical protein KIH69_019175 [Anaerolineae bacterium]|nr:hypothetical protein [Anaerolineae bacterium]